MFCLFSNQLFQKLISSRDRDTMVSGVHLFVFCSLPFAILDDFYEPETTRFI